MWIFYVNRGQAIASFGIESKDKAIMEFQPANKAYRQTALQGFRTFLKIKSGSNTLAVENTSDNPVYVTLVRKGIPLVSDFSLEEKGLSMKISYVNLDLTPVDHKNLVQGTDFMMVVKVSNSSFTKLENLALTQMVSSGWEIRNTRLFETERGIRESKFDYRDFRDDRVNTYFGLTTGETKTFILFLNAAYKGVFNQPSVLCEAMYTENCYSRHPGTRVTVTSR
jgi:uncharacterized protein YfaS (alpha-2-macroglobulin family)